MIYKTLHRKLKIEQNEPHYNRGVDSGALEGLVIAASHVTPVVFLLNDTSII